MSTKSDVISHSLRAPQATAMRSLHEIRLIERSLVHGGTRHNGVEPTHASLPRTDSEMEEHLGYGAGYDTIRLRNCIMLTTITTCTHLFASFSGQLRRKGFHLMRPPLSLGENSCTFQIAVRFDRFPHWWSGGRRVSITPQPQMVFHSIIFSLMFNTSIQPRSSGNPVMLVRG